MRVLFDFDIEINENALRKKRFVDVLNDTWETILEYKIKRGIKPKFVLPDSIDFGGRDYRYKQALKNSKKNKGA